MRKLEIYVNKYGPEAGRVLYHTLQSQAAHAGVSARLRRKIDALSDPSGRPPRTSPVLPLFPLDAVEEVADVTAEPGVSCEV